MGSETIFTARADLLQFASGDFKAMFSLSLHDVSAGCALLNSAASASSLGCALFCCGHSTASAFLRHFEVSSIQN